MQRFKDRGFNTATFELITDEVLEENQRQIDKWGYQSRTAFEWMVYLTEEVGELAQAISEQQYRGGKKEDVKREAIQVATLALKIATMFDRVKRDKENER